jgi:hypothetical protein
MKNKLKEKRRWTSKSTDLGNALRAKLFFFYLLRSTLSGGEWGLKSPSSGQRRGLPERKHPLPKPE